MEGEGGIMQYSREDACRAWLTYPCLSIEQLRLLMTTFGSAEGVYEHMSSSGQSEFQEMLTPQQYATLKKRANQSAMHEMLITMKKHSMQIVYQEDATYPDQLLNISDPPVFLFWIGNLQALTPRTVAMVGSRKASIAGLDAAHTIARDLSGQGVTVISGLAEGIDAAAHTGCLEGESPTVAITGCGLDVNYPASNEHLRKRILDQGGLLLSEYPPASPALGWHFPVRNRILSGLSRAVLMMECRIKSGSMSTVQHALNQGREVFAWPGVAGTEWAEGAHQLIREGARYFTSAQDVIEDLGWDQAPLLTRVEAAPVPPLSPEQKQLYQLLKRGDQSMDELALASGLDAPVIAGAMTILQVYGLVKALPGKVYHAI